MSKNKEYWLNRAKNSIQEDITNDEQVAKEIERIIAFMMIEIEKEISNIYTKYLSNNDGDKALMKKRLDDLDVKAFNYKAKKYVKSKDFSQKANEELKTYNAKMKMNREDLIKLQLSLIITYAYAETENVITEHIETSVYREIKRQSGILGESVNLSINEIQAIINSTFGNTVWSERLWENMSELRKDMEKVISHVIIRGRHPNEFVSELRKKHKQTVYAMKRLLITEANRSQILAIKELYLKERGEDAQYEFIAKLDEKTSKVCKSKDGKKYYFKDLKPGFNAPPMHPFCRSTIAPYLGDWRTAFFKERKGRYKL